MKILARETDDEKGVNTFFELSSTTAHSVDVTSRSHSKNKNTQDSLKHLLSNLFLPVGYPHSVSPDYLRYQIWNAIQACCSSLSGLLASRAVLEGFGVGKESGSATNAMLVTVAQDVFSRLTTIVSGYYLGTSLFPEAKTYRLLADVLNDLAVICDVISPHLEEFFSYFTSFEFGSSLRIGALCLSGCLRALCGVTAGGSKAALTLHFANGTGDIGDLNAKDGSKETVLVLLGLLLGTLVLPHVTTAQSTCAALFCLLLCHLSANYIAVRGLQLNVLNRQRATIAWSRFRGQAFDTHGVRCLSPAEIASAEKIFGNPKLLGDEHSSTGSCIIGCSFSSMLAGIDRHARSSKDRWSAAIAAPIDLLIQTFAEERFIPWYHPTSDKSDLGIDVQIVLKEGHTPLDHLKAWAHAIELVRILNNPKPDEKAGNGRQVVSNRKALAIVNESFPTFLEHMRSVGWRLEGGTLVVGSSPTVVIEHGADTNR